MVYLGEKGDDLLSIPFAVYGTLDTLDDSVSVNLCVAVALFTSTNIDKAVQIESWTIAFGRTHRPKLML